MTLEPRVCFEDTHLIVVSKPAGLLSQGEKTGEDNLVDWGRARFGRNYVGLVHRLDRNTSGLMVIAKRSKSADRLSEQLRGGALQRVYLAWIIGKMEGTRNWSHWLLKDEPSNLVRVVPAGTPGAKAAKLTVDSLGSGHLEGVPLTLARFELETGRSHQIRAQSAAEGFPLLGDMKYGGGIPRFPRLALHSSELSFEHPMSRERMVFKDPLPTELAALQD